LENWFQSLLFKSNLQRYTAESRVYPPGDGAANVDLGGMEAYVAKVRSEAGSSVGLYTLRMHLTHELESCLVSNIEPIK
jgi:hypothetical protein